MRKWWGLLAILFMSACGQPLDPLVLVPCSPVYGEGGLERSLAGAYKDPVTGSVYSIMADCTINSITIDACQTHAYIVDWLRESGTSRVNVGQSKEMAGCLPVGKYSCTFMVNPFNRTLQVDCGDKGVLNLNRL